MATMTTSPALLPKTTEERRTDELLAKLEKEIQATEEQNFEAGTALAEAELKFTEYLAVA